MELHSLQRANSTQQERDAWQCCRRPQLPAYDSKRATKALWCCLGWVLGHERRSAGALALSAGTRRQHTVLATRTALTTKGAAAAVTLGKVGAASLIVAPDRATAAPVWRRTAAAMLATAPQGFVQQLPGLAYSATHPAPSPMLSQACAILRMSRAGGCQLMRENPSSCQLAANQIWCSIGAHRPSRWAVDAMHQQRGDCN